MFTIEIYDVDYILHNFIELFVFAEDVQEYNEWCNNPPELKINL